MSDMISREAAIALAPRFPMHGLYCEKSPEERAALNAVAAYQNAIRALPAVEVGVRELEWFEVEKYRYGGKYTSEGYTIRYIEGFFLLDFAGNGKTVWRFPTIEAAKAAAQADYAARIRSALTATPAQDVAALAVKVIDDRIAAILADEESIMSPARQVISQWASSVIAELENIRAALARMKEAGE